MSASYDLCVIGAGSGGFGAACAAARLGMRVVLVEASKGLGGTSTWAGVNNYEPVAGATGLPWEVCDRLRLRPRAISLQSLRARYHPERPWGWYDCAEETDYRLSLSRPSGVPTTFEPSALEEVMREMLEETDRCTTLLQTRFTQVEKEGRQIPPLCRRHRRYLRRSRRRLPERHRPGESRRLRRTLRRRRGAGRIGTQ